MRHETLGALEDIRESIQHLLEDTEGMTFAEFAADRRTRQLVERNVEIIGEAVNRLHRHDPEIVQHISAWRKIIDLRNALIHGYDVIDYPTVWRAIQESLPVLRQEVAELLSNDDNDRQ